jgi:hypothetical protein
VKGFSPPPNESAGRPWASRRSRLRPEGVLPRAGGRRGAYPSITMYTSSLPGRLHLGARVEATGARPGNRLVVGRFAAGPSRDRSGRTRSGRTPRCWRATSTDPAEDRGPDRPAAFTPIAVSASANSGAPSLRPTSRARCDHSASQSCPSGVKADRVKPLAPIANLIEPQGPAKLVMRRSRVQSSLAAPFFSRKNPVSLHHLTAECALRRADDLRLPSAH